MESKATFLPRKGSGALSPASSASSSPSHSPSFTKRFSSHLPSRRRKHKQEKENQRAVRQQLNQQQQKNPIRGALFQDQSGSYCEEEEGAAAYQARSFSRPFAPQTANMSGCGVGSRLTLTKHPYAEKYSNSALPGGARSAVANTRERETCWLLKKLRTEINGLKDLLRQCITATLPAPGQTIAESLLLSSPRSEVIKGYCTLEGNSIVKADLTIKFPDTYKEVIRTQVARFSPYYLKQLATARNKANLALEALHAWPENESSVSRDVAEEIVRRVHALISDGQYAMKQPPRLEPLLMTTVDAKIFQPPLPPTVVIAFSIQSSVLQATILSLGPSQLHQHHHVPHAHLHHHHHHHHHHHASVAGSAGGTTSTMLTVPPLFKAGGSSSSLNSAAGAGPVSRTASPPGLGPGGVGTTATVAPSAAASTAGGIAAASIASSSFSSAIAAAPLLSSQPVVPPIAVASATPPGPPPTASAVAPGRTIKVRGEFMEILEEILVESRSPRLESLMIALDSAKREVERWKGCLAAVA